MLTLEEVLADAAASPGFDGLAEVAVNTRGSSGESPLHWMSTLGDPEGIRLLLAAGAAIDATNSEGNTPLHESVIQRQTQAAQALIEHGANVRIRNSMGQTPLDIAASHDFEPMIHLLQKSWLP